MPVVTLRSQARRNVIKVPTFGPRKSVRSAGPVGGTTGALVVNWSCDVRRVAKLPSEPRGDAYQIRQAKYVDSSHSNTRTSQDALGQGVSAILPYPCPTWSRTLSPHLEPKAPQKHLISKVSKPFGQSLPNPWMSQLRGKISFSRQNIVKFMEGT